MVHGRSARVGRGAATRAPRAAILRRVIAVVSFCLGLIGLAGPAAAQDAASADGYVAQVRLDGVIDQVNAAYIEEAIAAAEETGAAAIVIQVDSPGGELTSMDRIIKAILNSSVPVITWVGPEGSGAGSAATFITLAGDVAAMAPNTNIGAASAVGSGGQDLPETIAR